MSERESKRSKVDSEVVDNPYLAHHKEDHMRTTGGSSASGSAPFDGWIARKVTGKQVEAVMVSPRSSFIAAASRRGGR